ncbi:MAG: hypothetical protein HY726_23050 [Candidatus Rokubacteria bacterium]|nr:hypothetical protein [Candidatus Rokubacteria bacterium]
MTSRGSKNPASPTMFTPIRTLTAAVGLLLAVALSITLFPGSISAQSFPGGFVEKSFSNSTRPRLTPAQIQAFVPARGKFTFPAPYHTEGIRLTNDTDCGGTDCVNYVGYSYWRNINNHAGSDTLLIFLGLDRARGGPGSTLFSYNKATDQVTNLGPLFDSSSRFTWASGEGWYFSATQPTKLYVNLPVTSSLLRYDVTTRTFETVFDVATRPDLFGPNRYLWQFHSSDDDTVHSATLRDGSTYEMLGCLVYREPTREFLWFPRLTTNFNECNLDKSGRWLLILDGSVGLDNRIVDLQTGTETLILDPAGALGHLDLGDGYAVGADNWNLLTNATILIKFPPASTTRPVGPEVHYNPDWSTAKVNHVSHQNRKAGVAPEQQYACGSNLDSVTTRENEIVCFRLDTSYDELVVAPVMTDPNAPGGGDFYSKMPKGNLDVTGQYFLWTSNLGGNRLDALLVKVPAHLLVPPPDGTPPTVSITGPTAGATVTGAVTVSATATDNVGVVGVQFKLDGANLGPEVTAAPYAIVWDTTTAPNGSHTLTAVARDAAGNTATSPGVTVSVSNTSASGPTGSGGLAAENVVWTSLVNATASGNSLQKTSGCDGCPDAGATSQQLITAGDGYVEFTASETSALRFAGLSTSNPGTSAAEIKFAIRLQSGVAEVHESGLYRAGTWFATGDVFRVALESGVVKYYQNGRLLYTSTLAPTYPLLLDTALFNRSATITNAVIARAR